MTLTFPTVEVFFSLAAAGVDDVFTFNDATKGQLDDTNYPLAGNFAPVDVTSSCYRMSIRRGRNRETDEIDTGICTVGLRNYDARWLPASFDESGPYLDQVDVGKRVRVTSEGSVVFDGVIDDFRYEYNADGRVDAELEAIDALGRLARQTFNEWTTVDAQTAGPRITAVLDRSEVAFPANRSIDTGISVLQDDLVTWGSNVLNYLQLVAKSDVGRVYTSRDGVLTFRDRHALVNATAVVDLADDGTAIPYTVLRPSTSSEMLYTRVQVDREGGTLQTSNNLTAQGLYGIRTLALPGLLLSSDAQSLAMAEFLSGIYSSPQNRLAAVTVLLDSLTASQRALVAAVDIADAVSVTWTPTGSASAVVQVSAVEGVTHTVNVDGLYEVTWSLSPITQTEMFEFDNAVLGVLDSGVLAF